MKLSSGCTPPGFNSNIQNKLRIYKVSMNSFLKRFDFDLISEMNGSDYGVWITAENLGSSPYPDMIIGLINPGTVKGHTMSTVCGNFVLICHCFTNGRRQGKMSQ